MPNPTRQKKKKKRDSHSIFHKTPLAPVCLTSTTSPVNTPSVNSFAILFPTSALLPRSFPESSSVLAFFFFFLRGGGVTGVDAPELLEAGDADRFFLLLLLLPRPPAERFGEAAAEVERAGLVLDLSLDLGFGLDLAASCLGRPLPLFEGVCWPSSERGWGFGGVLVGGRLWPYVA